MRGGQAAASFVQTWWATQRRGKCNWTRGDHEKSWHMVTKEYSNGEITILWRPEKCIHSGVCVRTLPAVYHPRERPWIQPENATSAEIVRQVAMCPSGALAIKEPPAAKVKLAREDDGRKGRFTVAENGRPAGEMTYVWAGTGKFIIDHTEVAEAFGGRGLGKQLFLEAVAFAREQQLKILPLCPFARRMFDRYPEFADVRA